MRFQQVLSVFKPDLQGVSEWLTREELQQAGVLSQKTNGLFRHGVAFGRPEFKWLKEPQRGPIKKIRIDGYSNNGKEMGRPIRKDIREELLSKYPRCIVCGCSSSLIIDHKNDLYNDPRVLLDINTQTKDDFQSLCNGCNLRKRAVGLKRDKEKKRQPPTPDILSINGGIEFTKGDETYNPQDVNALVGTYWYDPIQFGKECRQINACNQYNYYSLN